MRFHFVGIIPARAGFTRGSGLPRESPRDHPRSRGVYSRGAGSGRHAGGSSPLARGLRLDIHALHDDVRIIPARAGFTRSGCTRLRVREGSSPLARGLPARTHHHIDNSGIIPARAGFTKFSLGISTKRPDHPRSRGVYRAAIFHPSVTRGSSPLARGLLHCRQCRDHAFRIIPARAGFT